MLDRIELYQTWFIDLLDFLHKLLIWDSQQPNKGEYLMFVIGGPLFDEFSAETSAIPHWENSECVVPARELN